MFSQAQFLSDVEAFLARVGLSPTAFGREAMSDPNFVFDLREGRAIRLDTVEKAYRFMGGRDTSEPAPEPERQAS